MITHYHIIIFLSAILIISGCMALPTQPGLTNKEKEYFYQLEKKCKCKVTRDIDPRKFHERANLAEKGQYLIKLDSLDLRIISQKDSLKKVSKEIAWKLYNEVLGEDFKYPYEKIVVIFYFPIKINSGVSEGYEYSLKELTSSN